MGVNLIRVREVLSIPQPMYDKRIEELRSDLFDPPRQCPIYG